MMSSMGSTRGNTRGGGRDKSAAKSSSQTAGKSGAGDTPVGKKATPDQIRLAQMFSDSSSNSKVDEKLMEKIKQVYDVTHKTEDEIMVALYDCQEDTERAINLLLERVDGDQGEWEIISSKKKVKSSTGSSSRGSNNASDSTPNSKEGGRGEKDGSGGGSGSGREKGGREKEPRDRDSKERDGNYRGRGRGGRAQLPPRMTKGRGRDADSSSRDRDRHDQNNKWEGGESGRGRGRKGHDQTNGPSRRGGRGPRAFTNTKFGTFEQTDAFKPGDNVWTNPPDTSNDNNMGDFTVSAWDGSAAASDNWMADDWNGDLAESKVFTPSSSQANTNSVNSAEPTPAPEPSPLSTNASMPPSMPATMSSMAPSMPATMSSMAPSMPATMAPSMAQSMAVQSSIGQEQQSMAGGMQQPGVMSGMQQRDVINSYNTDESRISSAPENFTRIDLAALFAKPAQHAPNVTAQLTAGPPSNLSDPMTSQRQPSSVFSQYGDMKPQPPMTANDNKIGMSAGQGVTSQEPPTSQHAQQRPQQQPSKPTKKRMPPPSTKIPLSAVEMPVSARGIGVLDVQFGAMEPSVDFGVPSMPSGVLPSSTSLQGSVAMPSSGQLPSSMPSYSMGESVAVTASSHLSSYPNKVQNDTYPSSSSAMNASSLLASSSSPSPVSTTLEQRSTYGQVPPKQMAPDPIPMPSQNQVGNFMTAQKSSPTQQLDSKSDKLQAASYTPTMPLQLSSLGSHPTSLANTGLSQSPSGMPSAGLHQQMGISSHPNQQLRQTGGSYHTTSAPTTAHSPASLSSGLSSISHAGGFSTSSHSASSHATSGLSPANLAGSNLSGNLSGSTLGGSSHPASSLGSHAAGGAGGTGSGMSSSSGLSSGPSTMSTQPAGLSSSVSGLTSSGHMTGMQTTVSNSMVSQSGVQSTQLNSSKLGLDNRMNSTQHTMDHTHPSSSSLSSSSLSGHSLTSTCTATTSLSTTGSSLGYNSISGMSSGMTSVTSVGSSNVKSSLTSNKGPTNLPPGMPLFNHQYIMGHGLLPVNPFAAATHQPFYNYDELSLQLSRMPIGYSYDPQQFPQPATTLTNRDVTSHSAAQYSVTDQSKFTRGEAASPVAPSLTTQQQQQQQQTGQAGHHQTQQATQQAAFLNAAATVPPGYGYGGLPFYPSPGLIPPGLQYQAAVYPATVPASNRSQAGTTPHSAFQQTAYGQHGSHGAYGTGYDDLNQSQEFQKGGYSSVSQTGAKGTGATVSVTSASAVPGDMSASSYNNKAHSQSYADKQGFHTGTPPPFNFPLASGNQGGPLQPATGYPHAPFVPMMTHNTMLPHQLHSDGQGGSSQRSQGTSNPGKPVSKPPYGGSTYWGTN